MERSVAAYLQGNSRVEGVEFARARTEISSTGRIDLMARAELLHCASHVASLVFEPCTGFEKLRQDAAPAERLMPITWRPGCSCRMWRCCLSNNAAPQRPVWAAVMQPLKA